MLNVLKKVSVMLCMSALFTTSTFATVCIPTKLSDYIKVNKMGIMLNSTVRDEARHRIFEFLDGIGENVKPGAMIDLMEMITGRKFMKERMQILDNIQNNKPIFVGRYNEFIVLRWYDESKTSKVSSFLI